MTRTQENNILEKLQIFAKENNLEITLYEDNKKEMIKDFNETHTIKLPLIIKAEFIMK